MTLKVDFARDDLARRLADEAHDRQRRDALAAAQFADKAEMLALAEMKIDAVDRLGDAVARVEVRLQSIDAEKIVLSYGWRPSAAYILIRGSSRSRSPSPRKLNPAASTKIARPGSVETCG